MPAGKTTRRPGIDVAGGVGPGPGDHSPSVHCRGCGAGLDGAARAGVSPSRRSRRYVQIQIARTTLAVSTFYQGVGSFAIR